MSDNQLLAFIALNWCCDNTVCSKFHFIKWTNGNNWWLQSINSIFPPPTGDKWLSDNQGVKKLNWLIAITNYYHELVPIKRMKRMKSKPCCQKWINKSWLWTEFNFLWVEHQKIYSYAPSIYNRYTHTSNMFLGQLFHPVYTYSSNYVCSRLL